MAQPIPCDYGDGQEATWLIGDLQTGQQHSVCLEHLLPWAMAVAQSYLEANGAAPEGAPEAGAEAVEAGPAVEPAPSFPDPPAEREEEPARGADDRPPAPAPPETGDGGGEAGLGTGGDPEPEAGADPGAGDGLEP